jgi:DNA-binding NtrC family response regulator
MQTEPKQFSPATLQSLLNYNWPGNARQLENEVKCLVASVREKSITEDQLDASIRNLSTSIQSVQRKVEPAPKASRLGSCRTRRAIGTPADRRGITKFWWQQTKSGSSLRPEPPGVD